MNVIPGGFEAGRILTLPSASQLAVEVNSPPIAVPHGGVLRYPVAALQVPRRSIAARRPQQLVMAAFVGRLPRGVPVTLPQLAMRSVATANSSEPATHMKRNGATLLTL